MMMLAEQLLRMLRAKRGFQHPQEGAARGHCTPPFAPEWMDVSNGWLVSRPHTDINRFQSRFGGCLERGAHPPKGARF
eukprot:5065355-Pyramimonas_sp.AAC.1